MSLRGCVFADIEPVSTLLLLDKSNTSLAVFPRVIRMVENHAQPLRCVAVGGYPPPSIEVHVGDRDVSSQFTFNNSLSLSSGVSGLRHIRVQSERWNDEFDVTADDDDTLITCVAVVPGFSPMIQHTQLHVDCESLSRRQSTVHIASLLYIGVGVEGDGRISFSHFYN